jgi:FixJ family two-component response regulator
LSPKRAPPTGAPQSNPEGPSLPEGSFIFLVDEDDAVRDALALSLRAAGHSVAAFGSGRQFLNGYRRGDPGCLVADMDLPDLGAVELLRMLAASQVTMPAIITSRHLKRRVPAGGLPPGRVLFLDKPFGIDELLRLIRIALAGADGSDPRA